MTLSSFFNECSTKMFHGWGEEIFKIKIFYFFYLGEMNVAVRPPEKGVPLPPEMPYYYSKQEKNQ